jgi:predicted DNA-binding transcriptional regulator AlpA
MDDKQLDSVRVLSRRETFSALNLDERTFDRIEATGNGPPKTQLSPRRIGYRLTDIQNWLDARRRGAA